MSTNQHPMPSDDDLRTTLTVPVKLLREIDKRLAEAIERHEVPDMHRNQYLLLLIKRGLAAEPSKPPGRGRVK